MPEQMLEPTHHSPRPKKPSPFPVPIFLIRVGHGPATGKRIIKNVLGKTQTEVKEKLAVAMEDANDLDLARSDDYAAGSCPASWYTLSAKPNLRISTAKYYCRSIGFHGNHRISFTGG